MVEVKDAEPSEREKPAEKAAKASPVPSLRIEVLTVCTVDGVTYADVPTKVEVLDSAEVRQLLAVGFARLLDDKEKVDA
jgi:hypothetical protein